MLDGYNFSSSNITDSSVWSELASGTQLTLPQDQSQPTTTSECSCTTTFQDTTPTTQEPPTCPPGPSEDIPTSQDTSTGDTHHNTSTDPSTDLNSTTSPSTPLAGVSPANSECTCPASQDYSGTEDKTLTISQGQTPSSFEEQTNSCTPLGAALGGVAASLAVILVGVVLGWVWHCYRNKDRARFHER